MVEIGQNLLLVAEAAENGIGVHATLDDLDGNLLLELIVGALGQIDGAHTAASDFTQNLVGADTPSYQGFGRLIGAQLSCRRLQEVLC
jgi:hypothetical protein